MSFRIGQTVIVARHSGAAPVKGKIAGVVQKDGIYTIHAPGVAVFRALNGDIYSLDEAKRCTDNPAVRALATAKKTRSRR